MEGYIKLRIRPTGKICPRCNDPSSMGYVELDTMCCNCYQRFVIQYHEAQLELSQANLQAAQKLEADKIPLADKEF